MEPVTIAMLIAAAVSAAAGAVKSKVESDKYARQAPVRDATARHSWRLGQKTPSEFKQPTELWSNLFQGAASGAAQGQQIQSSIDAKNFQDAQLKNEAQKSANAVELQNTYLKMLQDSQAKS